MKPRAAGESKRDAADHRIGVLFATVQADILHE